ncbi:hypothetical protein Tco_0823135, partial [Tanacetum coccineum]
MCTCAIQRNVQSKLEQMVRPKNKEEDKVKLLKEFRLDRRWDLNLNRCFKPVSKKSTVNTCGKKKYNSESTKEVSKSNAFDVLNSVRNDVILDDDGNPLVPTDIVGSDSAVEVVFDKTANLRLSTSGKDGSDKCYGTNSLLEQWRDSYPDNDDYDPYDDDKYKNQFRGVHGAVRFEAKNDHLDNNRRQEQRNQRNASVPRSFFGLMEQNGCEIMFTIGCKEIQIGSIDMMKEMFWIDLWVAIGIMGSEVYKEVVVGGEALVFTDMVVKVPMSHGRSSYARAMIELRADVELKDNIVAAMPKITGKGYYTCNIRVKYEWKPPRCAFCKVFGHVPEECPKNTDARAIKNLKKTSQTPKGIPIGQKMGFKPKQVFQPVSKKSTANTCGKKKDNLESTKEVSKSNPFDVLNSVENDVDLGTNEGISNSADKGTSKLMFVDDDGNPLVPTDIVGSDSEVEVVFDKTANLRLSTSGKDGSDKCYGNNSLLEQWRDSYPDNDDYDPMITI